MRYGGLDFGGVTHVQVTKAYTSAGAGSATLIPFEKLPTEDNGMALAVRGFWVRLPTATVQIAASKVLDGASCAQFIARIRLAVAAGTPPAAQGRRELIDSVDGYRALQALEFMSGHRCYAGAGGPIQQHAAGAADSGASPFSLLAPTQSGGHGFPQFQGPFGASDGTAADHAARPVFFLPIGIRDGEDEDAFAIPAAWFRGVDGQGAGELALTLGEKVDNVSISWGTEGIDVFAEVVRVPSDVLPHPLTPVIRTYQPGAGSEFKGTPRLMTAVLAFCKPLTAAGAMAAHGYSDVSVRAGGVPVCWNESTFHLRTLGNKIRRREWRPTFAETSLSNVGGTRYSRNMYPLVLSDGTLLKCPGSEDGLSVQIAGTTETSHDVLEAGWLAHSEASLRAAEAMHGPGVRSVPNTRNGNDVPASVGMLLPRRTVRLG